MSVKVELESNGSVYGAKKAQLRIKYTPLETIDDLKKILKNANIKIKKEGKFYKSFFEDWYYGYVLWIERDGYITMTYDIDDDIDAINQFTKIIEQSNGGRLFFSTKKGAEDRREELNPPPEYIYQTQFTDESIINQLFKNYNINAKTVADGYQFNISNFIVNLYKTKDENYEVKAVGKGDISIVEETLNNLRNGYDKIVQTNIINSIKQKVANSPTMQLQQEEELEDNSVLLTIRI